jgi:hypothetical protein
MTDRQNSSLKKSQNKSFINNLFGGKKRDPSSSSSQNQLNRLPSSTQNKKRMSTNTNRWLEKMEQQNRKNLTDGRIRISYDDDDLVRADNYQETRDQDRDDLERECLRTTNYIEHVKNGKFSQIGLETVSTLLAL